MGSLDDIKTILSQYAGDVKVIVDAAEKATAKEAVKKLRVTSPKRTGKYAKGWAEQPKIRRQYTTRIVYGKKPTYRLAHLLEHGHAKRGGGRVAAIEHIAPVEEWANEDVIRRVVNGIRGIP